jgi:hypothetical protein
LNQILEPIHDGGLKGVKDDKATEDFLLSCQDRTQDDQEDDDYVTAKMGKPRNDLVKKR